MRKSYLTLILAVSAAVAMLAGCYKQEATRFYMNNPETVPKASQPESTQAQAAPEQQAGENPAMTPQQKMGQQSLPESGYQAGPAVPDSGGYIPHAVGSESGSGMQAGQGTGVTPAAAQTYSGSTATQRGQAAPQAPGTEKSKANTPK